MEWESRVGTALGGTCGGGSSGSFVDEAHQVAMGGGSVVDGGWAMCGGSSMKVMTDEQIEVLRKQISAYTTICENLVEVHSELVASQPNSATGTKLGNFYEDTLIATCHKIPTRQRWNPTPMQLEVLEGVFDRGNGAPNRQKIKEITAELSKHGKISETNVYNWFQNRRARYKRKRMLASPDNVESEADTEVNSPVEEHTSSRSALFHEPDPPSDDVTLNIPGNGQRVRFTDLASSGSRRHANFSSDRTTGSAQNICLVSFHDGVVSGNSFSQAGKGTHNNQRMDFS